MKKTTVHAQRRNLRHSLADSFERKLKTKMKKLDASVMDISRLLVKLNPDYVSFLNVKDTVLGILNGTRSSETFCANLMSMLDRLDKENVSSLLGKFHQGYKEIPVGQSLQSRLKVFRSRKDSGARLVTRKIQAALKG